MPSTVIEHFNFDQKTGTLKITFVSGNRYAYKNVPEKVYNTMKISGSKGRYFNRFIKDKYDFEKLDDAGEVM